MGSGKKSHEGKAERSLLMEVSNLTIKKKQWKGLHTKWTRNKKAPLQETQGLDGPSVTELPGTSDSGSTVPVSK
jgi:hypothetical protein